MVKAVSPRLTLWRVGSTALSFGATTGGGAEGAEAAEGRVEVCTCAAPARSMAPPARAEMSTAGRKGPVPLAPVAGEGSATRPGRATISPSRSLSPVWMPLNLASAPASVPMRAARLASVSPRLATATW